MPDFKNYFENKKVTLVGLGLLGRGVGDAEFLAECGVELLVTDLKKEEDLAPSLQKLKKFKNITYVLGEHRLEDFKGRDFILKGPGVLIDSPYIAEARKNGIPIEMDASLFARLAPAGVTLVGVTGTRGKSTTTCLLYEILKAAFLVKGQKKKVKSSPSVFLAGNIKDTATLPLLSKVKSGDYVVLELDSWQLQGFGEVGISPHIAVFTNFMADHLNYYKGDMNAYFADKARIFQHQKPSDFLVCGEEVFTRLEASKPTAKTIVARREGVPKDWHPRIIGEHNIANIACALEAARVLKISDGITKEVVENFSAVSGRLEFLGEKKGVKIYNDNNATTPTATIAALQALGTREEGARKKIVLICGGSDKGLNMQELVEEIPKHCKAVVLLAGTGTEKLGIKNYELGVRTEEKETLKECVEESMKVAEQGDIVLFSPAFASFGKYFKNEYDRGEQFVGIVAGL